MAETILSSEWGGLSPHLLATFWVVDADGKKDPNDETRVVAAVLESNIEVGLNWQSPFENVGTDVLPTLQQVLETGEARPTARLADRIFSTEKFTTAVDSVKGKATITQLNSIQVFNGMPPVKLPVTLFFRAWKNSIQEVEKPFNQLILWSLPVKLEKDSTFISRVASKDNNAISTILPSQTPVFLAMKYKNRVYKPLVIESISAPLSSPIDINGDFVELTVQVQLASRAAIDRDGWKETRRL